MAAALDPPERRRDTLLGPDGQPVQPAPLSAADLAALAAWRPAPEPEPPRPA